MSAQLLALWCLMNLVVSSDSTASHAGPELMVYLKAGQAQPIPTLDRMKSELGALMSTSGYRVAWSDSQTPVRDVDNAELVVLELRGYCGIPAGSAVAEPVAGSLGSLGATYVSGDKVMPFSWLNCASLTRMLAPSIAGEAAARRDFRYGRAMARVLAHELYHVIANTREHHREGIAKTGFTVQDLLSDRFAFEVETLARLAPHAAPPATRGEGFADVPSGR